MTSPVQFDAANRALVRISLDGTPAAASALGSLQRIAGVEVVASDLSYGPGLVEAYVPIEALLSVAHTKGVRAVVPSGARQLARTRRKARVRMRRHDSRIQC